MKRGLLSLLVMLPIFTGGYVYGIQATDTLAWPSQELLRNKKMLASWISGSRYDSGRTLAFPGKVRIDCPKQSDRVAVFFVVGQSNAANYQGQRHVGVDGAINYADGACWKASSPLLGAGGTSGESWTLLANKLIGAGVYDQVVIAPVAIGGSQIARWADGDLSEMLTRTATDLAAHYRVTAVLFHQGESDFNRSTTEADYDAGLRAVIDRVRTAGITAPFYLSTASYDSPGRWVADNPVVRAQRTMIASREVEAGPNTDSLLTPADRYDDVHFGATGQEKFAAAWVVTLTTKAEKTGARLRQQE